MQVLNNFQWRHSDRLFYENFDFPCPIHFTIALCAVIIIHLNYTVLDNAEGGGAGNRYKLSGSGGPERGPKPNYFAYVFFISLGSVIICRYTN